MDDRQIVDYFIVTGLPENPTPLPDLPQKLVKWPIVDITLINKTQGELPPEGYECIELTPTGYSANLNHGSILAAELFLCYRRGRQKPPIIDMGVMYSGRDLPKDGCKIITQTPFGRSANVNNTGGEKIYITYIRADDKADSDLLAVVDICVILPGKNECPPHAYRKIEKNLNKGMIGSSVYLCYKKSIVKSNSLNYEAAILFRYPTEDLPDCPLPQVAMFCLPFGATIESWPIGSRHPLPLFSTYVLTGATGEKMYGAAVIFYEDYDRSKLTDAQKTTLELKSRKKQYTVHHNQSICILSRWPFFDIFKKFLLCIYRLSVSGPQLIPMERHIGHFMFEVPFPTRERPRILVQLSTESVTLLLPEETPLPKSGASFKKMLMNLGPENIISLLFYVLMEHRILIHSLRPDLLTSVAEAVASMIFPFRWQCPYIPLCPLQLAGVLDSPTPFIIGLDSQYFDMFDPPADITFVDLDTCTITVSEERRDQSESLLPKRPAKFLQTSLEKLYEKFLEDSSHPTTPDELDRHGAFNIHDFKGRKHLEHLELSIQEAFLCFMASLLKDYDKYLLPVTQPPSDVVRDVESLFNVQGFLNSRERAQRTFYKQMVKTQFFSRFIDERCFVSDKNVGLAFFDDCIQKLDAERNTCFLFDLDDTLSQSERTVYVLPPEPTTSEGMFSCPGFSKLQPELFLQKSKEQETVKGSITNNVNIGSILTRTKQEMKSFQKVLISLTDQIEPMTKCLVWLSYSLWFMCLPSHVQNNSSKDRSLEKALDVLCHMHTLKMQPLDEVCYRILMHLCCTYNQPVLAVKIYHEMKRNRILPNAITYGFYNKAVVESNWPSLLKPGARMWKRLKNVIFATAKLRIMYRNHKASACIEQESSLPRGGSGASVEGATYMEYDRARSDEEDKKRDAITDKQGHATKADDVTDSVHSQLLNNSESWQTTEGAECCDNKTENDEVSSGCSSRTVSVLTPVTENDPLGLFNISNSNSPCTDISTKIDENILRKISTKNSRISSNECGELTSKSKSCDELNSGEHDGLCETSSKKHMSEILRRGSLEGEKLSKISTVAQKQHAKTLSQLENLKLDARELPRTGSFGNMLYSAVNLVSSTYYNILDTLSPGTGSQNHSSEALDSPQTSGKRRTTLKPLQNDMRAVSADDLSFEQRASMQCRGSTANIGREIDRNSGLDYTDHSSYESGSNKPPTVSIQADLCTQFKCQNCANLLYDEAIMAGWSSNDSDLKTKCLCCRYNFVPMMQITLKDFRSSDLTSAIPSSDEQLASASSQNIIDSSLLTDEGEDKTISTEKKSKTYGNSVVTGLDVVEGNIIGRVSRQETSSLRGCDVSTLKQGASCYDNFGGNIAGKNTPTKEESFSVPYLSPLVLKKEMENLVALCGEDCLSKPGLINDHPIIYWNLVWLFNRLHLPSHLNSYIPHCTVLSDNNSKSLNISDEFISVRTLWDGEHTHAEYGPPMYVLLKEHPKRDKPENDEFMVFSKGFIQNIVSCILLKNFQSAIENVLAERKRNRPKGKVLYRSIYYDVLFLALSIQPKDFDIDKYDVMYKEACDDLPNANSSRLMEADRPPRQETACCRRLFGRLQLLYDECC